ncbi:MAG TPA: hypothetical protein PLV02_07340 [Candidatus Mcinerneyibacteriales bacterium]|nr:hypothetical protein [Candidatus Mcinerneyibacteriales bacterium]
MKYIKIILILAVLGLALFNTQEVVRPLLFSRARSEAEKEASQSLARQYDAVFQGLASKEAALDGLAASLSTRTSAEEVSGILEGNLSQFLWLEYTDQAGVPIALAGERTDSFSLSRPLPGGRRIEAGIDLNSFVETPMRPYVTLLRDPAPAVKKYSADPRTIVRTLPLDDTGFTLVLHTPAKPRMDSLLIIQGALLALGLFAAWLVLKNARRVDIPSLTSFFEQVEKGNVDLRFDIKNNDPLKNVKERVNYFLDSTQRDYSDAAVEKKKILSFCHTLHAVSREQTPIKQYQFFLSFLVNELSIESVHLFVKDTKQVLYFRGLESATIPSNPNLEKLFAMEEKSLLDEFDLSSIISEEDTSIHAYIVYPLSENATLLLPKSQLSHIKLDIFDIFIKLFKQTLLLHQERIEAIRNKVYNEKSFNKTAVGFLWAGQDGRMKKANDAARALLLIEEEEFNIFDFLVNMGVDTTPFSALVQEGRNRTFTVAGKNRTFYFTVSPLLLSDQGQYDLLFSLTDVTDIQNEKMLALQEAESTIRRYETEINRLNRENIAFQEQAEKTGETPALEYITAPMAASLSRTGKAIKTLLPLIFDDSEKRLLLLMRKELTSLNFLIRDLLIFGKEMELERDYGDIADYIKRSFDLVKQDLREKRCSVQAELKNAPAIQFDKTLVSLALFNLFLFVAQAAQDKARLTVQTASKEGRFFLLTTLSDFQQEAVQGALEETLDRYSVFAFLVRDIARAHGGDFDIRKTDAGLALTLNLP